MPIWKTPLLALSAVVLIASSVFAADNVRLLTVIFPPVSIDEGDGRLSGLYVETMREAARRVGHSGQFDVLPLARMNEVAAKEPNTIACIARGPERETKYQWIRPYGYDHMVLVTLKGVRYRSFDDLPKTKSLAVSAGSSMEAAAHRHGYENLSVAKTERAAFELLMAKRVDGWVAYRGTALFLLKQMNLQPDAFDFSAPFATMNYYIAASPGTPVETVRAWGEAFDSIVADGTYIALYDRYRDMIEPLAPP